MTTLVVPWRGDKPAMLECSLMTALGSLQPEEVMVIGGYEAQAALAFDEACSWANFGTFFLWASNPIYPVADPLGQTNAAMRLACLDSRVSDPFVWAADDLFWPSGQYGRMTLPIIGAMATWVLGSIQEARRMGQGIHGRALQRTHEDLLLQGFPSSEIYDFEGHWPVLVTKDRMLRALELSPQGQKRTAYGNLTLMELGVRPTVHADIKTFRGVDLPVQRKEFVSTGTGITEREVARWLNR